MFPVTVLTCPPKTDPVVKLVLHYIIGLRKGEIMPQKRYKPEQIINKLREAELALSKETILDEFVGSWVLQNRLIIGGVNNTEE
jgi:hypothetical protein